MKKVFYTLSFLLFLASCQEDPGEILASSNNPHEIKKALHILGQDTLQNAPQGLEEGTLAPYFAATDQNGRAVSLSSLTENGNAVVFFYRGYWCSICNKYLSQFQDSLSLITEIGASVVAIAPELAEYQERTIVKNNLKISVISDTDQSIMKEYKVAYEVNEKYNNKVNADLEKVNGKAILPVPATYIINKKGTIVKTFFNPDWRKRPSVKEIVQALMEVENYDEF